MEPQPTHTMHAWLKQLVGEWDVTSNCALPNGTVETTEAHDSAHMLGEYFIIAHLKGHVPGCEDPIETRFTIGYDEEKDVFPACWCCSVMPRMFTYEGVLSEDKTTLTLECEAPDMVDMSINRLYRDVITIVSDTERTFHTMIQQDDGSWNKFMWSSYTKVNA